MSTLKTHNLQSPDAGSVNIVMAPNAGMVVAGISTFNNKILLGTSDAGYPNYADNLTVSGTGNEGITIRSGATSQGAIYFSDTTGTAAGTYVGNIIYDHSDNHMRFATGGLARLRITSGGQIGINQTDIDADLHIATAGSSEEDGTLKIGGSENSLGLVLEYDQASNTVSKITANPTYTNTNALLKICVDGDANADQLVLKGNGNVGINENAPSRRLQIKSAGANATQISLVDNDSTNEVFRVGQQSDGDGFLQMLQDDGTATISLDASGASFLNGGNVGINESSPDNLLHLTTNSSTTYSTSTINTVNSTNALLRLENTNGGDGSGVNNYVGIYFRVANGANSDSQLQYVRTGDNAGAFHFKARNAGSTYPNLMTLKSDGNTGFNGVIDPKSPVHLGSNTEMRIGGQYGGLSPIMMQVQYAAGYTGTHWMFESNQMISWSFDGVLIVYGGGGSSYGSEVTKITIVYSRESGANNSGDMWRNGTTSYNIETLGHGQVGLNPSAGQLTVTEDTAPDGAGSQRSLFKLGWTTAGHGGATTTWSKLHGTMYWGTGSSGDVEIQDKDGNIFWDSNP